MLAADRSNTIDEAMDRAEILAAFGLLPANDQAPDDLWPKPWLGDEVSVPLMGEAYRTPRMHHVKTRLAPRVLAAALLAVGLSAMLYGAVGFVLIELSKIGGAQ